MAEAVSVWFDRPSRVALHLEPVGEPGPDEILVRACTSAISQGTEMLVYRGQVPPDLPLDLPSLAGSFAFPIKYGYALVGRVEVTGEGVETPRPGDHVFLLHPHQSSLVVRAADSIPLPPGLQPEMGVFYANTETAVNVVLDAHPHFGDVVLVLGQGVVGLLVAVLLKRAGVTVLVSDPFPERRELARDLGVDAALAPDEVADAVPSLTGGRGADIVIEASGNPAAAMQALEAVASQGTVVISSWYGTKPVSLPLGGRFHRDRLRIVSSQVGTINPALGPAWSRERRSELVRELLPTLDLQPLVTQRFPLQQAAEAYALIDRHPEQTVQVVLTYGEGDV